MVFADHNSHNSSPLNLPEWPYIMVKKLTKLYFKIVVLPLLGWQEGRGGARPSQRCFLPETALDLCIQFQALQMLHAAPLFSPYHRCAWLETVSCPLAHNQNGVSIGPSATQLRVSVLKPPAGRRRRMFQLLADKYKQVQPHSPSFVINETHPAGLRAPSGGEGQESCKEGGMIRCPAAEAWLEVVGGELGS